MLLLLDVMTGAPRRPSRLPFTAYRNSRRRRRRCAPIKSSVRVLNSKNAACCARLSRRANVCDYNRSEMKSSQSTTAQRGSTEASSLYVVSRFLSFVEVAIVDRHMIQEPTPLYGHVVRFMMEYCAVILRFSISPSTHTHCHLTIRLRARARRTAPKIPDA